MHDSDNSLGLENAILLAIHTAARPIHAEEPIPRDEMAALTKLLAEARLEETKMILGLFFDFRIMIVALPLNKYVAWKADIVKMLKCRITTASELDTVIGQLGNIGFIICKIFHFLADFERSSRILRMGSTFRIHL